jgi:hypothetical protein
MAMSTPRNVAATFGPYFWIHPTLAHTCTATTTKAHPAAAIAIGHRYSAAGNRKSALADVRPRSGRSPSCCPCSFGVFRITTLRSGPDEVSVATTALTEELTREVAASAGTACAPALLRLGTEATRRRLSCRAATPAETCHSQRGLSSGTNAQQSSNSRCR